METSYAPGLCGLLNLGNTCFMNSAIQCLSNVPELTKYFLEDQYRNHINRDNPLGMKGDIAQAYGELIHDMWSSGEGSCAPKSLKRNVARYAPQFNSNVQPDSHESMAFLLDALHEDLNLVKQKPYGDKTDDDGQANDLALAAEQWEYYRKRNQSKIHDIFHGQIKSVVQCLTCKTVRRTFDPISFLTLPLPAKSTKRTFKIEYIRLNGEIKSYYVKSNKDGQMHNLVQEFCDRFQPKVKKEEDKEDMDTDSASAANGFNQKEEEEEEEDFTKAPDYDGHQPKPDYILSSEIYNHRIHLQYSDNAMLTSVLERDRIGFYEVPCSLKMINSETILMPCMFQDDKHRQVFGYPCYLNVPRQTCTGKEIQKVLEETISNFLPLPPSTKSSDEPLYTAYCSFNQNYNQKTKLLTSCLDDHINFNHTNTSLIVHVAPSIVEKYKKHAQKDPFSSIDSVVQRHSQQKQSTTLLDCFKSLTKKEILSDDDLWRCPNCKELKKATKKNDLWVLPKVLIIQLKRFNYTDDRRDKNDLLIDCPLRDLDLSQFVANPSEKAKAKYDLIAVENHMGDLDGGHYTAHAKNVHDGKWHSFNDTHVSSIDENSVIGNAAYVLFYQQKQ